MKTNWHLDPYAPPDSIARKATSSENRDLSPFREWVIEVLFVLCKGVSIFCFIAFIALFLINAFVALLLGDAVYPTYMLDLLGIGFPGLVCIALIAFTLGPGVAVITRIVQSRK